MKKILSLTLVAVILLSMIPTAFAAENNWQVGTKVEYTATANEQYTVTVPAKLAPAGSGTVILEGTWANNRIVTVTADPTVTLTNSIKADDQKVLDVTFDGISEAGSNTTSQKFTQDISVENIENALFGNWSGKFNYNVSPSDVQTVTKVKAGLYDANNVLLADWDTLVGEYNLSVETDYDYDIPSTSMAYLLENYSELSTGTKLIISNEVTKIGSHAFYPCKKMTNIDFEEGSKLSGIGYEAFDECRALERFVFPAAIKTIDQGIFHWGESLSYLEFEGTIEQWHSIIANSPNFNNYSCWDYGSVKELVCSDGTITFPE